MNRKEELKRQLLELTKEYYQEVHVNEKEFVNIKFCKIIGDERAS